MKLNSYSKRRIFAMILLLQNLTTSSALLYIVRQDCTRGTIFTPVPSTVSNICLQCKCVMSNISYCKLLAVQLSIVCTAAITATTAAPATTASPTIPLATSTTATGINPRASPVPAAVMTGGAAVVMVTVPPVMMAMMMAMAGAAPAAGGTGMIPRAPAPAPASG